MRVHGRVVTTAAIAVGAMFMMVPVSGQSPAGRPPELDDVATLVARLDFERYKTTIRELTAFGDRREGTERNRRALDWIEAQLQRDGCTNTERMTYTYEPPPPPAAPANAEAGRSATPPTAAPRTPASPVIASGEVRRGQGGSRYRGIVQPTTPNTDPMRQPDDTLRALNAEEPVPGERQQVYCTKIGSTRPDEMYIVGAHMDGRGFGEAANDNASGTAIVMELARIFSAADVDTDRSIRFVLWNNEETGLHGARAYVEQRLALQGREDPVGSGHYPEPRWLAMIQHDMMLFDHGMRRADGTASAEQRPEADVNIEFQSTAALADEAMKLAFLFRDANEAYATDYPAAVGPHMTNTDSTPFMDHVPAISLRENERGMHIGAGWNPHWHQPSDRFETFSNDDFRLGFNAAQTTLGGVGRLAGARVLGPE